MLFVYALETLQHNTNYAHAILMCGGGGGDVSESAFIVSIEMSRIFVAVGPVGPF